MNIETLLFAVGELSRENKVLVPSPIPTYSLKTKFPLELPPVDAIVTDPFEAEVIVILFPAIR